MKLLEFVHPQGTPHVPGPVGCWQVEVVFPGVAGVSQQKSPY